MNSLRIGKVATPNTTLPRQNMKNMTLISQPTKEWNCNLSKRWRFHVKMKIIAKECIQPFFLVGLRFSYLS